MNKKIFSYFLIFVFCLTRLTNLSLLPIFNDEAIYIDWGQKMLSTHNYFFSLFDGKQPALMWVFGMLSNLFSDPLFGARLVSVLFDALSLFLIFKLSNHKSALLYLCSPVFLFFARQALMESALTALGLLNFYLILKFKSSPTLKTSLILGFVWGLGLNIKSSFLIFILAALPIIFKSLNPKNLLILVSSCFFLLIPLISQPDFLQIIKQNSRFSYTIQEITKFPIYNWIQNVLSVLDISLTQAFGLLVIPIAILIFKNLQDAKSLYMLFTIAIYLVFNRTPNVRYLIPFLPLAFTFNFSPFYYLVTLIYFLFIDMLLIFNPLNYFQKISKISHFSQSEIYLGGFTSGYGVQESVSYILTSQAKTIGIRLDAGNPENSVSMYLSKYPDIKVIYFDSRLPNLTIYPDLFITRAGQKAGLDNYLKLTKTFPKPLGDAIEIYSVNPNL